MDICLGGKASERLSPSIGGVMMTCRFVCATYDAQGQRRLFPPVAERYWQQHAAVIGAVLRPEIGLTVADIVVECQTYAHTHPEGQPYAETEVAYVVQVLTTLHQWDMVRVV